MGELHESTTGVCRFSTTNIPRRLFCLRLNYHQKKLTPFFLGKMSEPGSNVCDPAACVTANLMDSYGDGWNLNVLTIVDEATGATLQELTQSGSIAEGTAESFDFCTPCGLCFTGSVGGGSYTAETSWVILDSSGAVLASESSVGVAEWCISCASAVCGEGEQPNAADDGCEPCEEGYFSDASGSQPCVPCAAGTWGAGTGATECSVCTVGTASSLLAATEEAVCTECGSGKCVRCSRAKRARSGRARSVCRSCAVRNQLRAH